MKFIHTFEDIISIENLLLAWGEFIRGKHKRADVQEFQLRFMSNILSLHTDLRNRAYKHGPYQHFKISDPKPRDIHKATVRDRILHRALYRKLYLFFDNLFIYDSYSCRKMKGTHRAFNRFRAIASWVNDGDRRTCFVLKCDVRKFFASIDQEILINILTKWITNKDILCLMKTIIGSFNSGTLGKGLPLGNLTSQLLVNIYMNEFDQWMKHTLKVKYYIRYADDFVILHTDKGYLQELIWRIDTFLLEKLKLSLHPDKVFIKTLASGIDFLGWVHFPTHRVLRTTTKRRMFRRLKENPKKETIISYLGLLGHGNTFKLKQKVKLFIKS